MITKELIPIPIDRRYYWTRVIINRVDEVVAAYRLSSKSLGKIEKVIRFSKVDKYFVLAVDLFCASFQVDSSKIYGSKSLLFELKDSSNLAILGPHSPTKKIYLTYLGNRMVLVLIGATYKVYNDIRVI